jgi:hypothetical protein
MLQLCTERYFSSQLAENEEILQNHIPSQMVRMSPKNRKLKKSQACKENNTGQIKNSKED